MTDEKAYTAQEISLAFIALSSHLIAMLRRKGLIHDIDIGDMLTNTQDSLTDIGTDPAIKATYLIGEISEKSVYL